MSGFETHPGEKMILALLDGELTPSEAGEVGAHCEACEPCRRVRDGFSAVAESLGAQSAATPLRPVWPAVHDRLERERRRLLRPVFGVAAAAAVAMGVLFGLAVGSTGSRPLESGDSYLWSVIGSSLGEDGGGTLSGAWVRSTSEEERSGR